MDPSSPFAQSTRPVQEKNPFASSSGFGSFSQNGFGRAPMTPSKPLPPTPMQQASPSIFASSRAPRTTTAQSFRNPAFTTPRKPFDIDALSEVSASPAATDGGSDFPETPDHDQSIDLAHMTITPASVSRHRSFSPKKASGRGEIMKPTFPARDKVRKRKRYNADKDISGYRLPYIQADEGDSDYESDESTFQPHSQPRDQRRPRDRGWLGNFLYTLQQHPAAPNILGHWLNFGFSLCFTAGTAWMLWMIILGVKEDIAHAKSGARDGIVNEMITCQTHYAENKCGQQNLPAMQTLCAEWEACMNKNPNHVKGVQVGAKSVVGIINEIVDTMSYKTLALLVLLFAMFLFSGRSLYKTAHDYNFTGSAPPPAAHPSQQAAPPQVYWQAIEPQTPRRRHQLLLNDDTPETDTSPPPSRYKRLPAPETPSFGRHSPTKMERGRSPAKSQSPTKRR
ncbi:hypothetical protein NPX13_g6122 [Xylaria arbuscula]|uniref:Brl1/Brr6 domain-containing protein n=1 Tax=Xylaria arbuscula TaxID=114810 RepID=A0A9W8ND52_9PEZI|nr:hypothetical protein NPX13_g6122 [Xylaria arbuscula]